MRIAVLAACLLALLPATAPSAAQQMAVPMTVKEIIKAPPKIGQLVRVSGFLLTTDKQPKLQDTDNNRKLILDFSESLVTLESLQPNDASPSPIEVTGRMLGTTDNGKPIIGVIGAIPLTR